MSALNYWMQEIADRLSEATGIKVQMSEVVRPPDTSMGEFAYACFRLAKERAKSPVEIAREISDLLKKDHPDFAEIQAVGPYVNFRLATAPAVIRVVQDIEAQKEKYGHSMTGEGKELLLEYAQMNTHKEVHVGHLRNLSLGLSLVRILAATNWKVIPMSYHGDVGAHVAKCLWWLVTDRRKSIEGLTKEQVVELLSVFTAEQRSGSYLGDLYAESSQKLAERPEAKEEVSRVQKWLETHEPAWEFLWKETRQWSLDDLYRDFSDLSVHINRRYLESEVVDRGQEMVDHLLEKNIAKESQGAVIVDLEEKKLGIFLVRKSDGNSLYATKDLALAELKIKEYSSAARSLILADTRQAFYFKQLFATLGLLEVRPTPEYIGYEFVTLKSGAMSSREGNVVTYQSLRTAVIEFAQKGITERHPEWSQGKVIEVSWALAMAGMKFAMLRQDGDKIFTFDLEEALSFDGATGPYCQYAATRFASILRKAEAHKEVLTGILPPEFTHHSEKMLALALAQYPIVVEQAARDLRPSVIAQWCHKTAQRMNEFYRDVPVLESVGPQRIARLRLIAASRQVLAQGLELLGIALPDEM